MYDGELTGDLRAAGRSPPHDPRQAIAKARHAQPVPQRGVADRHQLRDVIARASTPTPAHERAESRALL
jgi:hypothetical protein